MQEASSGHGRWLKKSKLVVKEGVTVTAVEDGFSKADGSSNDAVDYGLDGFGSDGGGNVKKNW